MLIAVLRLALAQPRPAPPVPDAAHAAAAVRQLVSVAHRDQQQPEVEEPARAVRHSRLRTAQAAQRQLVLSVVDHIEQRGRLLVLVVGVGLFVIGRLVLVLVELAQCGGLVGRCLLLVHSHGHVDSGQHGCSCSERRRLARRHCQL